jgi:hypothetical protein
LKIAKEREKEEFTYQKYLKNFEKKNPFVLKRLPCQLLHFLAVVGAKFKKKIKKKKNSGEQSSKLS